jgi:hypothetical protein
MQIRSICCAQLCVLYAYACGTSAIAQSASDLREWSANEGVVARLGDVFTDSRISIRLPKGLQRAVLPDPPPGTGLYKYGWSPGGVFPSTEMFSIVLTPFAKPSSEALDQMVGSMKATIKENLKNVEFSATGKGRYRGVEVCAGEYTIKGSVDSTKALYLIGIDQFGSFSVIAMLPNKAATPERLQELSAAMFTFQRTIHKRDDASILVVVKAKADELAKAFLDQDYERVTDSTYPKLVELMGGREAVIAGLKAEVDQLEKGGVTCDEYTILMPTQLIKDGEKEFALVPAEMKMTIPGAKLSTKSYVLGISNDAGNTWTFLNGSKLDNAHLRAIILPDLPRELRLPEKHEPEIITSYD